MPADALSPQNSNTAEQSSAMIVERVQVLSREGQTLWVAADRASTCGACKAKNGCGTALYAKLTGEQVIVPALLPTGLQAEQFLEGDWVELAVDRLAFVKVSLILYLLPLAGLLLGVMLSAIVAGAGLDVREGGITANVQDSSAALAAVFGLFMGGIAASFWLKSQRYQTQLKPIVLGRIADAVQVIEQPITVLAPEPS